MCRGSIHSYKQKKHKTTKVHKILEENSECSYPLLFYHNYHFLLFILNKLGRTREEYGALYQMVYLIFLLRLLS
jgi:hypothetical protein